MSGMTPEKKISYFSEHVVYELGMLRGTKKRFPNTGDDVTRNALLESFAMHARNLDNFLRNKARKGGNTVLASHYNTEFKAKRPSVIGGAFQRLNAGMHHLGLDRAKSDKKKFNLNDAAAVLKWIEKDFRRFLEELPEPYQSAIVKKDGAFPTTGVTKVTTFFDVTATNSIQVESVQFTPKDNI